MGVMEKQNPNVRYADKSATALGRRTANRYSDKSKRIRTNRSDGMFSEDVTTGNKSRFTLALESVTCSKIAKAVSSTVETIKYAPLALAALGIDPAFAAIGTASSTITIPIAPLETFGLGVLAIAAARVYSIYFEPKSRFAIETTGVVRLLGMGMAAYSFYQILQMSTLA